MRRRTLSSLVLALAVAGVLAAGLLAPVVVGVGLIVKDAANRFLTTTCDVQDTPPPQRSTLYASDGKTVIANFFIQNRAPVSLAQVPPALVHALIATEDRRFYVHHGVDLRGLVRAALHDASGGATQGGSTLTMQYVKQLRYYEARTPAARAAAIAPNLDRKLQNAKCAIVMEQHFSKAQILAKYLNIAFFGENSYGVSVAAKTYFGVPVSRLTLPQSAMLVGLLQAPSQYDPFVHPQAALLRRNQVIENMVETHDLTADEAARDVRAPLALATSHPPPVPEGCAGANPKVANAGFFCAYAVTWLNAHGIDDFALDTGGLRIVSTLDARLQASGQRAIWRAGLNPSADYVLVMPSVDPHTGGVTSMISSRRYGVSGHGASMEPLFTAAYAGAGSTYKYFTAATALAAGAPTSLKLTTPNNTYTTKNCHTHYRVHNAGHYPDTMPLADALPQSSNTYFVALEDQFFGCQLGPVVDTAVRLGMNRLQQPLDDSAAGSIAHEVATSGEPTFTLGQEPTSPLELTGAFSAAVNDGMLCPPHPVLRVVTPKGAAMHLPLPPCHRVLSQYVARTVTTLMRADTTRGTAASYFRDWYAHGGASVAGKTGTDNNAADDGNSALWFVGMTPRLVSAASLVDPAHPKATVHGLPGLPDAFVAQDVFGAYASTYWLDAYGPALRGSWSWPSADQLDGATVPTVVGQERSDAVAQLQAAGYQVAVFPVECGSNRPAGEVAYQEPPRAPRGATVTICLSNGMAPYVYRPPVFVPRPAPRAPRPKPAPAPAPPPRHHHHHGG